jgi:hypothetical protein
MCTTNSEGKKTCNWMLGDVVKASDEDRAKAGKKFLGALNYVINKLMNECDEAKCVKHA